MVSSKIRFYQIFPKKCLNFNLERGCIQIAFEYIPLIRIRFDIGFYKRGKKIRTQGDTEMLVY